jgi:hypothetical protein
MYADWRVFKHPVSHSIYQLAGAPKPPQGQFEAIIDVVHLGTCSFFFKSPNIIYFLGKLKYPAPDSGILAWVHIQKEFISDLNRF